MVSWFVKACRVQANRKRTAITLSIHPIKAVGWHNNTVAGMKLFINDGWLILVESLHETENHLQMDIRVNLNSLKASSTMSNRRANYHNDQQRIGRQIESSLDTEIKRLSPFRTTSSKRINRHNNNNNN
ncbi:hypothetical protein T07_10913 [Trichinella nelsoni]|uniref:Uncharacterized protein n=1 Tax=Trichinella nelsoni TaxID=6336 RepID=A0A0V0RUM7_9BILA|nr:hypothetical protein T07_10913 [Trichinella nelsoni]